MNVVLAHGCFDLLHLGHIRHLQEAKTYGDKLVVSITDDRHVNKGLGRPHFTAAQRGAALLALSCVDDVIINDGPTAVGAITRIRPAVYVKGIDYAGKVATGDGSDPSLLAEQAAVEAVGGRLVFTTADKISSSSAILRSETLPPQTVKYLEEAKAKGFKAAALKAFDAADKLKISFVGEVIIDEYRYVRGLGKASKEMMLAVVEEEAPEVFEGGSIAASKHGEWKHAEWMASAENIKKTRYVDMDFNRKIFDVYSACKIEMSDFRRDHFRKHLSDVVRVSDVVVVLDFGHGMIGAEEREILKDASFLAVNAQTNAGNYGYNLITKYDRANYVCIDDPEARLAAGMRDEPMEAVIKELSAEVNCNKFVVTHGRFGSVWSDGLLAATSFGRAPALAYGGIDTMGAGDAVMAVTAPLVAAGAPLDVAAFVGNIAGAIKTSIIGHRRHVNRQEIIQTIEALLA